MLKNFTPLPLSAVLLATAFIAPGWSMDNSEYALSHLSHHIPMVLEVDGRRRVAPTWVEELGKSVQDEYRKLCNGAVLDFEDATIISQHPELANSSYALEKEARMNKRDEDYKVFGEDYEVLRSYMFEKHSNPNNSCFSFTPCFPSEIPAGIKNMKDLANIVKNPGDQQLTWVKGSIYNLYQSNRVYNNRLNLHPKDFQDLCREALFNAFKKWQEFDQVPQKIKDQVELRQTIQEGKERILMVENTNSTLEEQKKARALKLLHNWMGY